MIRISRPCYDKYWRCPGWAGGGMKYAKVDRCPTGASLGPVINWNSRWWRWRWHQCLDCKVWVMPYNWTRIAPTNIKWKLRWWIKDLIIAWKNRNDND